MPLSPMMQRYVELKEKYQDCLVFYRLGDFYEMFFDDAKIASKELQLALTGRDCGMDSALVQARVMAEDLSLLI